MSNTAVIKTTSLLSTKMGVVLTAYDNHLKLNSKSQEALYEALAEVYKFARLALETGNRAEFEMIAKSHDVEVAVKTDDNPYLPVTKTLFCEQKRTTGGKVYYTPLSVAYKYAKAIRHLMENGVDEKKVARYIADFRYTPKGAKTPMTKLAAIYKADTEAHPEENRGAAARVDEKKKKIDW